MQLIVKPKDEGDFSFVSRKIKGLGLQIIKENPKWNFITVKVTKLDFGLIHDLLETNVAVERDVKNDLD